jgi:SAM-dependent methyltransferase
MLQSVGYQATGLDPVAPRGFGFEQVGFEQYEPVDPVDAVVACNSLHHVKDPGQIVGQIATALDPDGVLIVVEWARE